jgi:DNA polymerase IIIc chi subunit
MSQEDWDTVGLQRIAKAKAPRFAQRLVESVTRTPALKQATRSVFDRRRAQEF